MQIIELFYFIFISITHNAYVPTIHTLIRLILWYPHSRTLTERLLIDLLNSLEVILATDPNNADWEQ